MSAVFNLSQALVYAGDCITCGVAIVMPGARKTYCLNNRNHKDGLFYCCNGHSQHYTGESEADTLKKQLAAEKELRAQQELETIRQKNLKETAQRQVKNTQRIVTQLKNRASAGLCGCCNRKFRNLERHMKSKHPHEGGGRDA